MVKSSDDLKVQCDAIWELCSFPELVMPAEGPYAGIWVSTKTGEPVNWEEPIG